MVSYKGKEVAGKDSSGKRRRNDTSKTDRQRKRKNRGVLQFFEDAAYQVDEGEASEDSDFGLGDDFLEDEFQTQVKVKNEPGKAHNFPLFPKEEVLSEEELDKMLEERYKPGSSFVTHAEDAFEYKRMTEENGIMPSSKDPTIWKVKCMVGRERYSAFCLMQKYVDLNSLGMKLQIISAFAVENVKGFIYIEAERQFDVNEASKGICTVYSSRIAPVPKNEVAQLLFVQNKRKEVSVGTWARVKSGKYKGDLAKVIAVNDARTKATVKLIPRIDLQALTAKYGGGVASKRTATPAPRLISTTELEEFRPLIQYRRDRDTGQAFEILDGMMLKDGYLYKKIAIDSLTFCGVTPTEDELLKYEPSQKEGSDCQEWLTKLYGEQGKKRITKNDKGGGKGEGSSVKGEGSSCSATSGTFEVHDLVFFNRKDFGVIVGTEKDDYFRILKEGSEGPVVVTIEVNQLKVASFDKKFTALDHCKKSISMNDTVRVLEGPLQGRQGIVKQIYRGIIFLHDENEQENCGYICCKSQICEKIKIFGDANKAKASESGPSGFDDFASSPKSPLSPEKPWEPKENNSNFNRDDKDSIFSIGQSLRIRVGPLKGYLCRVLAIRRSDVTVKLDSRQKILTVKPEHLSEVRGKTSAISLGDDSESIKPFGLLGTQDGSADWMAGAGTSTEGERWGAGGGSTERSSWPAFPSSGISLQLESNFADAFKSVDNDTNKDLGDAAWESKVTQNQSSPWGGAVASESSNDTRASWGKKVDASTTENLASGWSNATASKNPMDSGSKWKEGGSDSSAWGKAVESMDKGTDEGIPEDPWGKSSKKWSTGSDGGNSAWNNSFAEPSKPSGGWDNAGGNSARAQTEHSGGSGWGKPVDRLDGSIDKGTKEDSWVKPSDKWSKGDSIGTKEVWNSSASAPASQTGGWSNAGSSGNKQDGGQGAGSSWGNQAKQAGDTGTTGWGRGGSNWGKTGDAQDRGCGKGTEENSWSKASDKWSNGGNSSGSKAVWGSSTSAPESQTCGWGNTGGSSWNKQETGSSRSKQAGGSWSKKDGDGGGAGARIWGKAVGGKAVDTQFESTDKENEDCWNKSTDKWDNKDSSGGSKAGWGTSNHEQENKTGGWGNAGGSSWNKRGGGSSWNKQDAGSSWSSHPGGSSKTKQIDGSGVDDSKDGWDKPYSRDQGFDGGRGSGGRRGTEGFQGGRDRSGQGRSFGQGQSSGWSERPGFRGRDSSDSWGKVRGDESGGSTWGKAVDTDEKGARGWENSGGGLARSESEGGGWKKSTVVDGGQTGGWEGNIKDDSGASGWGSGSSWGKAVDSQDRGTAKGMSEHPWDKAPETIRNGSSATKAGWNSSSENKAAWDSPATAVEKEAKGWGRGSTWGKPADFQERSADKETEEGSWGKAVDNWQRKNSSSGTKVVWNQGSKDNSWGNAGGSSWNKEDGGGSSWNNQGSGSSWSKQSDGKTDEDQSNAWSKPSRWGQGSGGWKNNGSSWSSGQAGEWGRGNDEGEENRSEQGGYRGRGGFRGRGRSDEGGYGGRGRSDRGGFRGRGRLDRGGFGGRGQGRRDQGRDWSSRNESGENQSFGYSKGSGSAEGWKSNEAGGSWKSGGCKQSWNSGRNSSEAPGSGGSDVQSGGWSQGNGTAKNAGESDAFVSGGAVGWNKGGSSWSSAGNGSGNEGTSGCWNQKNATADGGQSSSWNVPKSGGDGGQADPWGKARASSWGQRNDGGTKTGGTADRWGKPEANSWGKGSDGGNKEDGKGGRVADPWGKAAGSSRGQGNDGGSKRGW
ncbi:hypothetical protein NMG60_11018679 [Bertholletia excelsa]